MGTLAFCDRPALIPYRQSHEYKITTTKYIKLEHNNGYIKYSNQNLDVTRATTLPNHALLYSDDVDRWAVRSTIEVPSLNRVRNRTLAFVNNPSLSETTMNWEPLNRVLNRCPMCWVCDRSKAASISSKMYIGAGLNWSRDMINDKAMRDLEDATSV